MKIYDISMTIESDMFTYKNIKENRPDIVVTSDFSTGDFHETEIKLNSHTGTHVDAPLHMLEGGETIEYFNIQNSLTHCRVLDLTEVDNSITSGDLERFNIEKNEFIIFKTKNSETDYLRENPANFIYLEADGAKYLAQLGVKGVGIDSLGVERDQKGHPTHKALLANGIIILEGLRLKEINEGEYTLLLAPLKIEGSDGAPARVLLVDRMLNVD